MRDALANDALRFRLLVTLPHRVHEYYNLITPSSHKDSLRWEGHPSGIFSVKSFLNSFATRNPILPWGKAIWRKWIPPRISLFLWRFFLNGLPLDTKIKYIGIPLASICSCCRLAEEDLNHLFFMGEWAANIWNMVCVGFRCTRPLNISMFTASWVSPIKPKSFLPCFKQAVSFLVLVEIWASRNRVRHDDPPRPLLGSLLHRIREVASLIPYRPEISDHIILRYFHCDPISRPSLNGVWRYWDPGDCDFNLDMAFDDTGVSVRCAAIVRAKDGTFKFAQTFLTTKSSPLNEILSSITLVLSSSSCRGSWLVQSSHPDMFSLSSSLVSPWLVSPQVLSSIAGLNIKRARRAPLSNTLATSSLLSSSPHPKSFWSLDALPRPTRVSLLADLNRLPVFIPHDDSTRTPLPDRTRDDSGLHLRPSHAYNGPDSLS